MSTAVLNEAFILNESDIEKILSTPSKKLPETKALHDINLSHDERIKNAKSILASRRCK
ncbi:hypothetical protein ABEP42_27130 [Priestia megaterium]|uniref:hypothetical protein n=1 Tax=Priestia TaxID=2800373 RepID=UPI001C962B24|nr:hypothetical protein [Priestia flexa]MBY6087016.1 hypothetical protein [Priestia flexa]